MKKRNIILTSLGCVLLLSSCTQFISKNYDNKEKLLEAVEKINSYDYTKDFTSMLIYANSTYKAEYDYGEYAEQGLHSDTAIVEEKQIIKVDFSNEDDLFIYYFTEKKYRFLTGYDSTNGSAQYDDISGAVTGYQFYKKNGSYTYNEFAGTRLKTISSLELDKSYLDSTKIDELRALESSIATGLTQEQGSLLFHYYLMPEIEHSYRINEDILDNFVNDGTNIYEFGASDREFSINGDETCEFTSDKAKANEDGTFGSRQTVLTPVSFSTRDEVVTFNTKNATWVTDFTKETSICSRSISANYIYGGWLSKALIDDSREDSEYNMIDNIEKLYTTYDVYTEFNINIPHIYYEK